MIRHITAAEAVAAAAQPGTEILDVRSATEVAASGTVRGALCIPATEIARKLIAAESADIRRLLAANSIVVFCAVGARAKAVAEMLESKGAKNVLVFNAFRDWVDAGGAIHAA